MKWGLIDSKGIVTNIIEYDGESVYIPDAGITLIQINDWCHIGYPATITPEESYELVKPVPVTDEQAAAPDVSSQLIALLIDKGVIASGDLKPETLASVNADLVDSGEEAIAEEVKP